MEGIKTDVHSLDEVTTMLRYLVTNCPTKTEVVGIVENAVNGVAHELRVEIKTSQQMVMDHTTKECAKVRGDLISLARRQDSKSNEIIYAAEQEGSLSKSESVRLRAINPFSRGEFI